MGAFLETEKARLAAFKATSSYFSSAARADGVYRGRFRPYCLPRECAEENLFPEIRQSVTAYFAAQEIKWHDAQDRRPSNHLLGSSATEVWKRLVSVPGRFASVSTEELFGRFPVERFSEMASWWEYIRARYAWVGGLPHPLGRSTPPALISN